MRRAQHLTLQVFLWFYIRLSKSILERPAENTPEEDLKSLEAANQQQLYYIHYNGMDRRLDEWIDKSRIVREKEEYTSTLTTPIDQGKTLTRYASNKFINIFKNIK